MASSGSIRHVVAMPYPGRGHINPLLNFCKLIASHHRPSNIVVTFIVTEEWHGFLSSDILPENLHLTAIPQVIPSEIGRGKDWAGFVRATLTKLEEPVEQLLDRLDKLPKPCVIIFDTYMKWVVDVGSRRNIPVASFWTQSATVFSILYHFDRLRQNGHFNVDVAEKGEELVDYIPGVAPLRVADLPTAINGKVYSIGPAIPYWKISHSELEPEYMKWLDAQPVSSVLYISQGSFLSASSAQLDEIVAGVYGSGVRFFWITRDETIESKPNGLVVPWCDQLRVLSHSSIGGFWSHCGWNSTKEGIFAGLPMLCFPIFFDQVTNTKQIVEDWKTGIRAKRDDDTLISREQIAELVKRFMDYESDEGKELRKRAKHWQDVCVKAVGNGGSSSNDLNAFIEEITIQQ